MKLSIVLTVYNKGAYIRRAIDSLLSQQEVAPNEYEVLVVNDGSTDNSESIVKEYALKDNRVRLLSQTNQGLSIARNNGFKKARGEYVWFVDADDTIALDAVCKICDATDEYPDVIPIYAVTEGIDRIRNAVSINAKTGKDILIGGKWEHCGVFNIFRKKYLEDNHLSFLPGIYHEDSEFTPRVLYEAQSVKVIPNILYYVFRDPNSITQVPRAKRAFDYLTVAERIFDYVNEKKECGTQVGKAIFNSMSVSINYALLIICQNDMNDQKLFNIAFYDKRNKLISILRSSSVAKYRIESFLFSIFPKNYIGIYKLLKLL